MSYSERLIYQGSFLTRLAHRSRYGRTLRCIQGQIYDQVLDYGCGDGLLLRQAYEHGLVRSGVGVDISIEMLDSCSRRFPDTKRFQFIQPDMVEKVIAPHSCDLAICTETLEHVATIDTVLSQIAKCCRTGAKLIVSAPIEIGPALIFKQLGRYLANRNDSYGYERYLWSELFAASVCKNVDCFPSSHTGNAALKGHKGFDYRKLDRIVNRMFTIEAVTCSPFPWLGPATNSTMLWVCSVH